MALTYEQLILLDTLIYSEYCNENGQTVGAIIQEISKALDSGKSMNICSMSDEQLRFFISTIENDPELMSYNVTQYYYDEETGMKFACFVDDASNPADINVIFKGTSEPAEWHDNGVAAYVPDSPMQMAAAEYINNLPEEYGDNLVVSGHSKGGNLAQYVTIVTDRIAKCVSVDGQGMSQEFVDKYAEEIARKAGLIVSICASWDYVNPLCYTIAGTTIYIQTEEFGLTEFYKYHIPIILLDENGNLNPEAEQAIFSIFINEFSINHITNVSEPYRSYIIDGLISLFEKGEGEEDEDQQIKAALYAVLEILFYIHDQSGFEGINELWKIIESALFVIFYEITKDIPILRIYFKNKVFDRFNEVINLEELLRWIYVAIISYTEEYLVDAAQTSTTYTSFNAPSEYIRVDTDSLRECADQLTSIYRTVVELNYRIEALYKETGWLDLKDIIDENGLLKYGERINDCINWCKETADDFEQIDHGLTYQF